MRQDHPLIGLNVIIQVHLVQVIKEWYIQFESVISPGAEFQKALLFVEGEVRDVDDAGGLEDGLGDPQHRPVARHHGVRIAVLLESVVRTVRNNREIDVF